jgi:hypothetical protein
MAKRKGKLITLTDAELVHIDQAARARGMRAATFIRAAAISVAGPMAVERRAPAVTQEGQPTLPGVRR